MGRRSRAVEQVLGKVIEQAVTEGDEQLSKHEHEEHEQQHEDIQQDRRSSASVPAEDGSVAAEMASVESPAQHPMEPSPDAAPHSARLASLSSEHLLDDLPHDEEPSSRSATVGSSHPQFDTSQAVMHGIAHSLNLPSPMAAIVEQDKDNKFSFDRRRTFGDQRDGDSSAPMPSSGSASAPQPTSALRAQLAHEEQDMSSGASSQNGSVSLGRAPSSAYFRPDAGLTLKQFREAVTHQHEVSFSVGKGGKPLGKPSLSSKNLDRPTPPSSPSAPGEKSKSRSMKFAFKTYAGAVFARIRAALKIDSASYVRSLAGGEAFLDFVSNSKSGQFFFFTDDKRYMIKTMSQQESIWFRMFLPDYYQHLSDYPNSFLVRIVGLYRLQCRGHRKLHFMVMRNVFATPLPSHVRFDLKGSSVGRAVSPSERKRSKGSVVLKDLDFDSEKVMLQLGPHRTAVIEQLRADAAFLSRTTLMDYSMLVGIYRRSQDRSRDSDDDLLRRCGLTPEEADDEHVFDERGIVSRDADGRIQEIYFFGIIDFLQKYNWRKKTEHFFKSLRFDSSKISAVHPRKYANRFCRFIEQHLQ